ncbi:MAG: hypothetical protein COA69_05270 [Robiginitomaculum sp.]|nr:MAG: hypothetical protein COA69_05270 [Robiginitomaculum sp.]
MFFKTLFALVITVVLAGGAVYFLTNTTTVTSSGQVIHVSPLKQKISAIFKGNQGSQADMDQTRVPKISAATAKNMINVLLEQAQRINSPELQDQAYIDIVNYALDHQVFDAAGTAMKNIRQIELRDTARGQMAVSMVRAGKTAQAFEIIDQVEIDGLRDVLRLQAIEAIVLPQNDI